MFYTENASTTFEIWSFSSLKPSDAIWNLVIIGSGIGFMPVQHTAWTNAELLLIWPWGINFREIWVKIQTFSS